MDDCILPDGLKKDLQAIVDSGEMQNLMFSGGPGCGKTTAALAMCSEMGAEMRSRSTVPKTATSTRSERRFVSLHLLILGWRQESRDP